ncbi:ATP-dependent RNA helicase DDX51 isoform X1 [Marmota flaviventris]|uniref:ATP-dependent RNA helicase DDX51 isoform X1 n=1 Tax=Marmota flaviventris TaxID=93162 RepID=UPI003A8AD871
MALFHVARYPGPGAAEAWAAEVGAGGRARVLLERLQCRARERQQQQREPAPVQADARCAEAAGRRRRRRPRRRRRASRSPDARLTKRRRELGEGADESEDAGAPVVGARVAGPRSPAGGGADWRVCGAGTSEAAPEQRSAHAESPQQEAGCPSPGPVLGGFARRKTPKVQPFLPAWLAKPSFVRKNVIEDLVPIENIPEVHPDLQKQLRAHGISAYFPVQAAVIPALLESVASGFLVSRGGYQPSDLCVSAPTGSGKTLAFVIPVVQALMHRVVCQVRALVVLPTKELAQQVSKVFNVYTDATPLRVALVTGQKSLAKEQESLVQKTTDGYRCLADIVVATPGRLVDHIDQTPGFNLQQLRFLVGCLPGGPDSLLRMDLARNFCQPTWFCLQVVDEADRMIDSMHQSWLPRVVAAAFHSEGPADPCALLQRRQPQAVTAASTCRPQMPLQKLLFSATLTQNPEKLQRLGLYQPRLFSTGLTHRGPQDRDVETDGDSGGKYTFPMGLTHHYVPCSLSSKPLAVLHLVLRTSVSRALCFTNSREHSHRLFLLAQAFGGVNVAEFSSRYGPGQRRKILKHFEQGKIQLLISTDATARGIDVQGVELVINYDAPQYLRTYVHRVGRTARAGRTGQAFTLLLKVQERRFLRMLAEAGAPELSRHEIPSELLQPMVPQYEEALSQLEKTIKEEQKQKVA